MKSPTIESESYLLRPFKKSDAELWQTWDIDPEVQAFMPEALNELQDIEEQYKYIEECEDDKGEAGTASQHKGRMPSLHYTG